MAELQMICCGCGSGSTGVRSEKQKIRRRIEHGTLRKGDSHSCTSIYKQTTTSTAMDQFAANKHEITQEVKLKQKYHRCKKKKEVHFVHNAMMYSILCSIFLGGGVTMNLLRTHSCFRRPCKCLERAPGRTETIPCIKCGGWYRQQKAEWETTA